MRTTLGLDDEFDGEDLQKTLEVSFGIRFDESEAMAARTVDDIHQMIRRRLSSASGPIDGCATAMAFYRLRRALSDVHLDFPSKPRTIVDGRTTPSPRCLLIALRSHSDLRLPRWRATATYWIGLFLVIAGLGWLLLNATIPSTVWPTGAGAVALGFGLIRSGPGKLLVMAGLGWPLLNAAIPSTVWSTSAAALALGSALIHSDPGKLPADCQTFGDLARRVAGLNFGTLYDRGATARDKDIWDALLEVLSEETGLRKTEIGPETLILRRQLRTP